MGPVPPPFNQPAAKTNTTKIVLIVLAFVLIPCAGLVGLAAWLAFFGVRTVNQSVMPLAACGIGFRDVREALVSYAKEKGAYPAAATWQDDIREHYRKVVARRQEPRDMGPFKMEVMSPDGDWGCKIGEGRMTGMAFNSEFGGLKLDAVTDKSRILIYEIPAPRRNAAAPYKPQPEASRPRLFGEPRQWIVVPLEGEPNIDFGTTMPGEKTRMEIDPVPSAPPAAPGENK
jgi:hypothetical protein